MMDHTAHCMSDLRDLTCCCRGMGSATVSHPEVADDKCSAALDIPKVAPLYPQLCTLGLSPCRVLRQMCRESPAEEAQYSFTEQGAGQGPSQALVHLRRMGISITSL